MKIPELLVILKGVLEHVDAANCEVFVQGDGLLREVLKCGDGKSIMLTNETWEV